MGIRLLILGANGQLGHSLSQHAKPALGETLNELVCWGKDKVDFTKPDQIVSALKDVRPDVVINAAAYTQVEKAEDEPDIAHQINAKSVGVLAEQAKKQDVVLVHYSTDYVFDGTLGRPYVETDPLAPVNAYGQSKAEGENYLLQIGGNWVCFRTGWVYAQRGHNFCKTMLEAARTRDELHIVDDQFGAPTPATWLAELGLAVAGVVAHGKYRKKGKLAPTFLPDFPSEIPSEEVFHASAAGETTWFDYAELVLTRAFEKGLIAKMPQLNRVKTESMGFKAQRPPYAVLNTAKLVDAFRLNPPDWKKGVKNWIDTIEPQ